MRRSLTKGERLGRGSELTSLFRSGKRIGAGGVRLVARRNGRGFTRVAVVNARGYRRAVDRNLDRRLARETYRALKDTLAPGYDLAIVLYPRDRDRAERRAQITALLGRLGRLPGTRGKNG
jgi:ribonuclease P protein component